MTSAAGYAPEAAGMLAQQALAAVSRGDADMVARVRRARAAAPEDPMLVLAEAEAEFLSGLADAGARLAVLVEHNPGWVAGHRHLASIRREQGDERFARSFEAALAQRPRDAGLWGEYIAVLAGSGQPARAADAAAAARARGFDSPTLLLIEAQHAEEAGEVARAEALVAAVPRDHPDRLPVEARLRLVTGDLPAAAALLDRARAASPSDLSLWALTEMLWRATGDVRADWLVPPGAIGSIDLGLEEGERVLLAETLRRLHGSVAPPLDQSVRGGTQTRGLLFDRAEPAIVALRARLQAAVDRYRAGLPKADPAHPLLRHRDRRLVAAGGWSVRLTGGGAHHASHIHPGGVLSSACYIVLPLLDHESGEGALELGRPPPSLRLDLPPRATVTPREGLLVLFPSYLYHGTRAFPKGERLTVAFDAS